MVKSASPAIKNGETPISGTERVGRRRKRAKQKTAPEHKRNDPADRQGNARHLYIENDHRDARDNQSHRRPVGWQAPQRELPPRQLITPITAGATAAG